MDSILSTHNLILRLRLKLFLTTTVVLHKDLAVFLKDRLDCLFKERGASADPKASGPLSLTLHWKFMCSRFSPPSCGGGPSSVGPKTIERLETDIELIESFRRILNLLVRSGSISSKLAPTDRGDP